MRALSLVAWSVLIVLLAHCGPSRHGRGGADADADSDSDADGPPCDRDADGYETLDCGGDDCDDGAARTHPGAPDAPWSIERLTGSGEMAAFAMGPDGARHLVVGRGLLGIQVLTDVSGSWTTEVLEAARYQGHQTGLALGPAGAAHVVWVPEASRALRYATNATGDWITETIDATLRADYPCIAIDDAGTLHVAYEDQDSFDVRHATREGGVWRTESLGMRGMGLSLALGPDGAAHLAFGNPGLGGGAPTHATNASGAWTSEPTGSGYPSGVGTAPSLAIGPDGVIHVAWVVQDAGVLRYASNAAGSFAEQDVATLGPYGGSPSIAVDDRGRVHLAATAAADWSAASLLHAVDGEAGWTVDEIAAGRGGIVRIDPDGIAAILHTATDFELAIAHHDPADGVDQDCDGTPDRRSGLPPSSATTALSAPEAASLCDWAIELQGGEGARRSCTDGTVTVGTVSKCLSTRGMCQTVEDFEACMLATAADLCALETGLPPACAACTSGVDPARTLAELTQPEWQAWCEWSISTQGGEGHGTSCADGQVQVGTVDACVSGSPAFARCGMTVAEADTCSIAMAEDACTGMDAPACAALVSCLMGG